MLFFNNNTTQNTIQAKLCLAALASLIFIVLIYHLTNFSPVKVPVIQGKILNQAINLQPFVLVDQYSNQFTNKDLQGDWHFISFGYTQCPDVCPTTLMTMVQLSSLLADKRITSDVNFVFYSVDSRDTSKILLSYIEYFDANFIALKTSANEKSHNFEENLGIKTTISNNNITDKVEVSHNLLILVINPDAALQAVFYPTKSSLGLEHFIKEQLYSDFVIVEEYYLKYRYKKRP